MWCALPAGENCGGNKDMISHGLPRARRWLDLGRFIVSAVQSSSLKDCYDDTASIYSNVFGENQVRFSRVIVDFLRRRHPPRYKNALDLGAGTGILTRRLPEICDNIYGIDFSLAMLEQAIVEQGSSSSPKYVVGDIFSLPLSQGRFDLIVSLGVITHILPKDFERFVQGIDGVAGDAAEVVIGLTPLPWRLFAAGRHSFETTCVDRFLINLYNMLQKAFGMDERRGVYYPETLGEEFIKYGYAVEHHAIDDLAIFVARR